MVPFRPRLVAACLACLTLVLTASAVYSAEAETGPRVSVLPVSDAIREVVFGKEGAEEHKRVVRQINFGDGNVSGGRPSGVPISQGRPVSFPSRPSGNRPGGNRPLGNRPIGNRPVNNRPNLSSSLAQCDNCVSLAACSFAFAVNQNTQKCSRPDAGEGVCCPQRGAGSNTRQLFKETKPDVPIGPVSISQINSACQKGISFIQRVGQLENQLIDSNQILKRGTPERGHQKFFRTTRSARAEHSKAQQIAQASQSMMSDLRLTAAQGSQGLRKLQVRNSILAQNCPVTPRCNPGAKYRTIDGTCNNLGFPLYGKSETAFQRILPPVYDDGVSAPRSRSATGGALPNERVIASNILVDRNDPDQKFTLSVMQWAQFIDHDLTHAPFPSLNNGEGIECCPNGVEAQGPGRHPECLPIPLQNDLFYKEKGRFCMNFVRSMLGLNQDCTFGFAEQMNQLTHWLDASMVYGSNEEEARRLRSRNNGLLIVSRGNLLPIDQSSGGDCEAGERNGVCYIAGDSRVNEQPGLTAIHILFHREHNRVATNLKQLHPGWSDEALYQEARRIVTAEIQHIIFNEWLPIIVGHRFMDSFGINALQTGYSFDYNPQINPNMNNEFATGAFRFGHSLVQSRYNLINEDGTVNTILMREHFNSPHIFQQLPNALDGFSRAFTRQAIQKFDSFVVDDLSNHLFQTPRQDFGMDLMSLNLHRGRDHAIAPYNAIREVCGLPRARTFQDLNDQIPIDLVNRLQSLYAHPDDIDFFVGGMSEKPVSGGLLGWTFLCVVGDQFARVKKGDRFFYDIGGQPGSFNPAQLQEIRKVSWARILCDNSNRLQFSQPLAFQLPNNNFNRVADCNSNIIPRVNLNAWANEVPQA